MLFLGRSIFSPMYPAPSFEIAGTTVLGSSSFVIRLTTRNGGIFLCGRVTITRSVPIRDRDTDKSVSVFGSRFSFRNRAGGLCFFIFCEKCQIVSGTSFFGYDSEVESNRNVSIVLINALSIDSVRIRLLFFGGDLFHI